MRIRRTVPVGILTAVLAVTVAGCGGDKPATKRQAKPTPSAKAAATPGPPHAMGEKVVLGGTVQAVVFQYVQPAAPAASASPGTASTGAGGRTYGAADVQVCVSSKATAPVAVSWKTWSLVYPDTSIVAASTTDSEQFSQPEYPFVERGIAAGRCVRGWITFSVPADKRPAMVEYTPHQYVADWTVPAA